jgi:acyl dehydratase
MLYAEDLHPGLRFPYAEFHLSEQDIIEFARTWDPLPSHVDPEAARQGEFGGIIASASHTFAVCVRLTSDAMMAQVAVIAGKGIDGVRLHKPVRPGDTLSGHAEIVERRPRSQGRAEVTFTCSMTDQSQEPVLTMTGTILVRGCQASASGP